MRLIKNTGGDRVVDEVRRTLTPPSSFNIASPVFSLFAFSELREFLERLDSCWIVLANNGESLGLTGTDADLAFRNRLNTHWLARDCAAWADRTVQLRVAPGSLPQSILIGGRPNSESKTVITGNCAFSTEGLGITPGNQFGLIQCSERPEESAMFGAWFTSLWNALPDSPQHKAAFLARLRELADPRPPVLIYYLTLFQIFRNLGDQLDEERIVKSATGIRNTTVWKKLYKFQRDGIIGAIDKLERLGGCIIADSVGLGKTFEALTIIKYYELRNNRVLVLVPKRLRDNWTRAGAPKREGEMLTASRERGVIGCREIDAQPPEDRGQDALGLTQRQVEDETERQGGFDGEIGILELPAPPADASRCPRGDRVRREPAGDVASPHEGSVVLGPVPDAIRCLVLRMHSRLHIEILTRRRSRWSNMPATARPRAESAHQRP